jgi:hypothetical protein
MTEDRTSDNLNALRYLSGEMTADEGQAFEALLAQGGSALDDLSEMVLLVCISFAF